MKTRLLTCVLCLLLPLGVAAESFRCGKWIVSEEMPVVELINKCGPPTTRESKTEDIRSQNQFGLRVKTGETTTTEILTWDRGPNAAPMVVIVVDGTIKKIERKRG